MSKRIEESEEKIISKSPAYIFMNIYVDIIFYIFILIVTFGSYTLYVSAQEITNEIKLINPEYEFSSYYDLYPSIIFFILLIIFHKIFKILTVNHLEKYLSDSCKNDNEEILNIYKNKVSTNIYKFFFFYFQQFLVFMF